MNMMAPPRREGGGWRRRHGTSSIDLSPVRHHEHASATNTAAQCSNSDGVQGCMARNAMPSTTVAGRAGRRPVLRGTAARGRSQELYVASTIWRVGRLAQALLSAWTLGAIETWVLDTGGVTNKPHVDQGPGAACSLTWQTAIAMSARFGDDSVPGEGLKVVRFACKLVRDRTSVDRRRPRRRRALTRRDDK